MWNGVPDSIPENSHPDVLVVVHNLGNVVNIDRIRSTSRFRHTIIVEDCCEALGGMYNDKFAGSEAEFGALSFYATKAVTSGEGGAFTTTNPAAYEHARLFATQGQGHLPYQHISAGYNFRMSNIQAAILYGQLDHWQEILERKEDLFGYYRQKLEPYTDTQVVEEGTHHAAWQTGVQIPKAEGYHHSSKFFNEAGIEIRPFFYPIDKTYHLSEVKIPQQEAADTLSREVILLPSYPQLIHEEKENLDYIIEKVKEYAGTC